VSHNPAASAMDPSGIAWLDATQVWLARFPLSIIQLAGRIGVGATFFKAGLLKYQSWEFTVRLFQEEPLTRNIAMATITRLTSGDLPPGAGAGLPAARRGRLAQHDV
jgi:hypothetical protein